MQSRKLLFLPFLIAPLPGAAEQEGIIWIEYPSEGVVLGQGYNLLEDRPTYATCVDFIPVQDPSQQVEYRFEEVTSHTQTKSLTNISASGSMKMAVLNASARLSFLSNENFFTDTKKFFLTARVTNSTLFAAPSVPYKAGASVPNPAGAVIAGAVPAALPGKRLTINPNDARDPNKCGHGFVSAIVSGAAIDAFLTYSKTDAAALADIRGGLEADLASVFKVSGSFQQRQESVSKQESTSISLYRFGGKGSQLAYDLSGLKASLKDIVKDAIQTPKPIRVGILPYKYLSTQPDFSGAWSADTFSESIDAFFMAKDVFERTGAAIQKVESLVDSTDRPERKVDDPILLLKDARSYIYANTEAMRHANRLSTILLLCRQETNAINETLGRADTSDDPETDGGGTDETPGSAASGRAVRSAEIESVREAAVLALGSPRIGVDVASPALSILPRTARSATAALVTVEDWAEYLTELYNRDAGALSAPLSDGSGTAMRSEADKDRIQFCQTRISAESETIGWVTDTFLAQSAEHSLRLQALELSMRPIYWSDLGALRKEKIERIVENDSLAAPQKLTGIKAVLDTFQEYIRSTGYRREICAVSFTHPICGTGQDWIESAGLADDLLPDLGQILKELEE